MQQQPFPFSLLQVKWYLPLYNAYTKGKEKNNSFLNKVINTLLKNTSFKKQPNP